MIKKKTFFKMDKDEYKFPYRWTLADATFTKNKGKVFSCFACGGGSSMGYKLAGFDVIGCNEIDPKMMSAYIENHSPKYSFLEPIQTFKNRQDLPPELFNLDILDGSPPCSSFSMAGNREKDWGKEKKFREGQAEQVLDTLFFDFIDLAKRLQPKVVVAENVTGILLGKAKKYVREIYKAFDKAGYTCEHFKIDSATLGVPQRRERVFFIAMRKDLAKPFMSQKDMFTQVPKIDLEFNEREIPFGEIEQVGVDRIEIPESVKKRWDKADHYGRYDERARGGIKFGYFYKLMRWRVCATIMSNGAYTIEPSPHYATDEELALCGTFPLDYNYVGNKPQYIIGMSVPPVTVAQIATRIHEQWLSKIILPD
jgi:DNA (cytosine-5)-methyltransferase 1